jgi:hypothetical protein
MSTRTTHLNHASKTLRQAADESPLLAQLSQLMARSRQHLASIQHLIPNGLRAEVTAGPVDDETWCVLVTNTTVASKMRQLVPDIERYLLQHQQTPLKVRIKVMATKR